MFPDFGIARWLPALCGLFLFVTAPCSAQTSVELIRLAWRDLTQRDVGIVSPSSREALDRTAAADLARLQVVGPIDEIVGATDQVSGSTWLATGRAVHAAALSDWQLVYSRETEKIVRIELTVTLAGEGIPALPDVVYRGGPGQAASIKPNTLDACRSYPELCTAVPPAASSQRLVEFLFATTRAPQPGIQRVSFSGERGAGMTFGAARVRIPEDHKIGKIELPSKTTFISFEIYEQKTDPKKHFIIKEVRTLSPSEWNSIITQKGTDEALIFVHGYNTSFDESLYRMAQIVWDLQYRRTAVLFTWASRGSTLNYVYDRESALIAASHFTELLRNLTKQLGVKRLHVLAHSMGNFVAMEAMKGQTTLADPLRIAELIMAAPDVDRDYFSLHGPDLAKLTSGTTLYASSADKAISISRALAGGVPRAADVVDARPLIVNGVEAIDVTAIGSEMLGLNHDVFASRRHVMNDIGLLLSSNPRKPPHQRLVEILAMPEGSLPPQYWRYAD